MSNRNYNMEPFGLMLSVVIVFTLFSFVPTEFSFRTLLLKPVSTLSDIQSKGLLAAAPTTHQLLDSAFLARRGQQLGEKKDKSAIVEYGADTLGGLIHFHRALEQLEAHKRKKVRIAYFGDSMIEGDLLTQDLRNSFQDAYGGEGVGFMPITSIVAGFRQTILHSFSGNWKDHFLTSPPDCICGPGITGHTFQPATKNTLASDSTLTSGMTSWVNYGAVKRPHLDRFCRVRLFYGQGNEAAVSCNGRTYRLEGEKAVNVLSLAESPTERIHAGFTAHGSQYVYGFSMDSDSGIFVDNFSMRGNSGLPLVSWPVEVLRGLDEELGYDLIILHFGVNVVDHNQKSYNWYKDGMTNVINNFRKAFPHASILIIGAADKGWRGPDGYETDPAIPLLIKAQRDMAVATNSAFWSLYDAMGGARSMVKWVQGDTIYANKDYTHFNHRGARRVALMLYNELIREYRAYQESKIIF
jgi:hypothetical protein